MVRASAEWPPPVDAACHSRAACGEAGGGEAALVLVCEGGGVGGGVGVRTCGVCLRPGVLQRRGPCGHPGRRRGTDAEEDEKRQTFLWPPLRGRAYSDQAFGNTGGGAVRAGRAGRAAARGAGGGAGQEAALGKEVGAAREKQAPPDVTSRCR